MGCQESNLRLHASWVNVQTLELYPQPWDSASTLSCLPFKLPRWLNNYQCQLLSCRTVKNFLTQAQHLQGLGNFSFNMISHQPSPASGVVRFLHQEKWKVRERAGGLINSMVSSSSPPEAANTQYLSCTLKGTTKKKWLIVWQAPTGQEAVSTRCPPEVFKETSRKVDLGRVRSFHYPTMKPHTYPLVNEPQHNKWKDHTAKNIMKNAEHHHA